MKFKTLKIVGLALAGSLVLATGASAAPTADATVNIQPKGNLYKQAKKPVDLSISATITPGAGETSLNPLINAKFTVPKDLAFVPNPKMPVCTAFNETTADAPPETARSLCPKAIIGDGKASLYIAQSVAGLVTDPVITIFNGKPDNGSGVLVIQAWSTATNHGILMSGEIKGGVLSVNIPRLTFDSSVPSFQLNIPGSAGQDPSYAQASCSSGTYTSSAEFTLGKRDATGVVSDKSTVSSPAKSTTCVGLKGNAKFGGVKVKGPKKVKNGKKGAFKVTVTNKGTATAKNVKVAASGGGKGSGKGGNIAPGSTKTITVKAKIKGKKGKKVTVKFKVSGGASASAKTKVKVG